MKSNIYSTIISVLAALLFSACNGGSDAKPVDETAPTPELTHLRKAMALRPDSVGLRYLLMDELLKNKLYAEAIAQNDTLMKLDSTSPVLLYRRGDIQLQKGDTTAGVLSLQLAIKSGPMFMEPQLQLAAIYADQSKPDALVIADNIIHLSQDPKYSTQARFIKGLYYSNINDKPKAIEQFNECIKNDYTFLDAYVEKGLLLYDLKNYAEALKVFEQTIQVSNGFAEGYYNAGRCEEALGNNENAVTYYQKALGLDKTLTGASEGLKRLGK